MKPQPNDVARVLALYQSCHQEFRNLALAAKHVTVELGRGHDEWRSLYTRSRRSLSKTGAALTTPVTSHGACNE